LSDGSGNLWLFGGYGYSENNSGYLNDLWKYDRVTNQWTWMKGDKATSYITIYGQQNVFNTNNKPGGRRGMAAWKDATGKFWILGGDINELWKYDPSLNQWTWVSGSNLPSAVGNYGTMGVAGVANIPPSRFGSIPFYTNNINPWLFGGFD